MIILKNPIFLVKVCNQKSSFLLSSFILHAFLLNTLSFALCFFLPIQCLFLYPQYLVSSPGLLFSKFGPQTNGNIQVLPRNANFPSLSWFPLSTILELQN